MWMAGGVVAVIAALGAGQWAVQARYFGPAAAVRAYFSALSEHDAGRALRSMAPTPGERNAPLLTAGALRGRGYTPPSGATVVRTSTYGGTGVARVRFRLGGRWHTMGVGLRRDHQLTGGLFHRWRVTGATGALAVAAEGATEVRVNGRSVTQTHAELTPLITAEAFPGRYTVDLPDNPLLAAAPQQVDIDGGGSSGAPNVALATRVKPSASAAVEQQVRAYLDGCAQSTDPAPDGCPFSSYRYGDIGSPKWTIADYPEIAVALRDGVVAVSTTTDGTATFTGTEEDFFGGRERFSEDATVTVAGYARLENGQVRYVPEQSW